MKVIEKTPQRSTKYDQIIMCPVCFHGEPVEIEETAKIRPKNMSSFTHRIKDIQICRCDISLICGKCGHVSHWSPLIDPEIYPTIKILNEKGYTTEYCCSGHDEHMLLFETNVSNAYISFTHPNTLKRAAKLCRLIDENLPDSWYFDRESSDEEHTDIRAHYGLQQTDKERNYLKDILRWAKQLPKFEIEE